MPSPIRDCLTSSIQKWPPAIQQVIRTIDRFGMLIPNEKVLIGVSGGPDSMALLHILHALAPFCRLKLAVAHLNHGLRINDADKDEMFVKQMAAQFNLPFYSNQASIRTRKGSVEELARNARYAFFNDIMHRHGQTKIALGHQKNDNAEVVLMHLLRGSGIRGLAGIPPVRNQRVVRPLILSDRAQIMAYLKENNIPYVVDATNADQTYKRNRIRHHLIPILEKEYNVNIIETLHRTAELCREEDTWFNHHLRSTLDEVIAQLNGESLKLNSHVIASHPLALQRRLIREALKRWCGHLRRVSASHIDAVLDLLTTTAVGKKINLPNRIQAMRKAAHLCFSKGNRLVSSAKAPVATFCYPVHRLDQLPLTMEIPESNCRVTFTIEDRNNWQKSYLYDKNRAWFDIDELDFPIRIRNFRPGDRINPYGMQGSQKLKKLFIDRKIPVAQRHHIALLESHGIILWVTGIRRSMHALVSKKTLHVLCVCVSASKHPTARANAAALETLK